MKRRIAFAFAGLLLFSARAMGVPITYEIFRSADLVPVGSFSVDPDLAAPVGLDEVLLADFEVTATIAPFGPLTATLADAPGGSHRAVFFDGQISSLTGFGGGTLPSGHEFFLDFLAKPDPEVIDLAAVGTMTFDAGLGDEIGESEFFSIGISIPDGAPVPEPSAATLFALGALCIAWQQRRS